jgi:hypothetical protein
MLELTRHPLSAAFPSFSDTDLDALVEDIRAFGQRESGLVFEGMILDGWNRYQACVRLGIEFNYIEFEEEYPGVDPEDYVVSKNLHRRHMTDSQRAASVVAVSRWVPVGRPNNLAHRATLSTNAELAHRADVSERTISRAKVAHEAGLGGAVIAGEMTLRQAEEAVKAQRAPTIREQKAGTTHEGAGELAARTDAVATKPPLRQRADEDSSSRLPTPLETAIADRDEARDHAGDLADELRIAKSELDAYRAAEIGEGEKHLIAANKRVLKLEDEVRYLTARRDALMDENAQLKREIKSLSRRLGIKANG